MKMKMMMMTGMVRTQARWVGVRVSAPPVHPGARGRGGGHPAVQDVRDEEWREGFVGVPGRLDLHQSQALQGFIARVPPLLRMVMMMMWMMWMMMMMRVVSGSPAPSGSPEPPQPAGAPVWLQA